MAVFRFLYLLFLLLSVISLIIPKSTSEPTYLDSVCPITKAFAPNSNYQAKLNTLFHSLSSNASVSAFFSSSANSIVYGLFLCRGDLNTAACSDCVSAATTADLPKKYCRNRKVAVIWYDECMVRYSNHPVFEKMETSPLFSQRNEHNTTRSLIGFSELLKKTLNDVVARAASDGSGKKFATSEVNMTAKGIHKTLYAMGQCTPDLNATSCSNCLMEAVRILPLSDGGRVLQPSCYVRYEIYPFFTSYTAPPPVAPPQPLAPTIIPQRGVTSNSPVTSPGKNANDKGTHSPRLTVSGAFGSFVALSLTCATIFF